MNGSGASARNQRGSILLEGLIAILIFSMGILALMGLQAQSIKNTGDAKYRADAGFIANKVVARMWANGPNVAVPPAAWLNEAKSILPNSNIDVNIGAQNLVTIVVRWRAPQDANEHNHTVITQICPNNPTLVSAVC